MNVVDGYRNVIKAIKPFDDKEKDDKKYILKWLKSTKNIYRDQSPQEHLCAYFPLITTDRKKIFLVHHRKSGLWLPNGGHVEKGETLEETVEREFKEELGIALESKPVPFLIGRITTVGKTAGHIHNDIWFRIFIDQATRFKLKPSKREFFKWDWFALEKAAQTSGEPDVKRAVKKVVSERD